MNRWLVAVAVGALLVGLALMVTLAPDTGPPVALGTRPVVAAPEVRRTAKVAPVPPRDPSFPTRWTDDDEEPGVVLPPPSRKADPLPPIDPDQVFAAELQGLASAAVARRDRFLACWEDYDELHPETPDYEGRLTVRITVSAVGDHGEASTEVVNGPADEAFSGCVAAVMADARFESPGDQDFAMMWPVPIRTD